MKMILLSHLNTIFQRIKSYIDNSLKDYDNNVKNNLWYKS